ncbi:MAG TPA: sigma-70 family RNA polymerase sigma factor [Holophagaceae bacterium]|nr:sigma-70 family RNA polymerase sigma factor [Holophagaceae bacterium]
MPDDALPLPAAPPQAREQVLASLRARIVAFAASRNAGAGAEDLAQEVLVVIHTKYGHLDRAEDLVPLAFQILRFKLAAAARKAVRRGEGTAVDADLLADSAPDPEAEAERRQRLERLAAALARLGECCRDLFRLKLLGRSFAEIQAELRAESLNTVYTWDHRCRKRLLEEMGGRW